MWYLNCWECVFQTSREGDAPAAGECSAFAAREFGSQTDNECCASACNSKSIGFEPFRFFLIVNVALQMLVLLLVVNLVLQRLGMWFSKFCALTAGEFSLPSACEFGTPTVLVNLLLELLQLGGSQISRENGAPAADECAASTAGECVVLRLQAECIV